MPNEQFVARREFEELKKYVKELEKDYENIKSQLAQKKLISAGRTHPRPSPHTPRR